MYLEHRRYTVLFKGLSSWIWLRREAANSSRYIKRYNEELTILQSERRPGRPPNPRESELRDISGKEDREYSTGFWMPDMENEESLRLLRDWNGQWSSLSTLRFIRLMHGGAIISSSFPPKGKS